MKVETEPDIAAKLAQDNARFRGDLLTVAKRISHDLRTPLGGIITIGEMLKETLSEGDATTGSSLAALLDSAADMARLIERVSFILKATANPIAVECMQMGDVVFRVLQSHESKILKKQVMVSEPSVWPEAKGVFSWTEVIWGNLLLNAIGHAKDRIELGWQEEKSEICFSICDDGAGVPREKNDKLFQSFDSLHQPNAALGLGLPIVRRLVELQGGRWGYKPQAKGGSCFFFTLPSCKK